MASFFFYTKLKQLQLYLHWNLLLIDIHIPKTVKASKVANKSWGQIEEHSRGKTNNKKNVSPSQKNINIGCLSQTLKCMQRHMAASVWEVRTRCSANTQLCVYVSVCAAGGGLKPDQSCRVVVCSIRSFEIPTDLASNKTRSTTLNVPIGALYCWMQ